MSSNNSTTGDAAKSSSASGNKSRRSANSAQSSRGASSARALRGSKKTSNATVRSGTSSAAKSKGAQIAKRVRTTDDADATSSSSKTTGKSKNVALFRAMQTKSTLLGSARRRIYKKKYCRTTRFKRPRTLRIKDSKRYCRYAANSLPRLDQYSILKYPLNTESAMRQVERRNTLVFIVDINANKPQIKAAFKKLYGIKAVKVNTLIRPDGKKKAYVRLSPDQEAADVASRAGIL